MERTAFLDRIRGALAGVEAPALPAELPHTFGSGSERTDAAAAERFVRELALVGGEARRVGATGVRDAVRDIARRLGDVGSAVVTDDLGALETPVHDGLEDAGCLIHAVERGAAATAGLGVTSAALGVASTGSLLLQGTAASPRITSLLPPTHLAVVPEARLVPGFEELFERMPAAMDGVAGSVLVTGPSRTADIELQVVRGVHGPRDLFVLLVASFACPACGFGELLEPPWSADGVASRQDCPCCGVQFGLHDDADGDLTRRGDVHREWRARWIERGMPWFSSDPPPPLWDPGRQVRRFGPEPLAEG